MNIKFEIQKTFPEFFKLNFRIFLSVANIMSFSFLLHYMINTGTDSNLVFFLTVLSSIGLLASVPFFFIFFKDILSFSRLHKLINYLGNENPLKLLEIIDQDNRIYPNWKSIILLSELNIRESIPVLLEQFDYRIPLISRSAIIALLKLDIQVVITNFYEIYNNCMNNKNRMLLIRGLKNIKNIDSDSIYPIIVSLIGVSIWNSNFLLRFNAKKTSKNLCNSFNFDFNGIKILSLTEHFETEDEDNDSESTLSTIHTDEQLEKEKLESSINKEIIKPLQSLISLKFNDLRSEIKGILNQLEEGKEDDSKLKLESLDKKIEHVGITLLDELQSTTDINIKKQISETVKNLGIQRTSKYQKTIGILNLAATIAVGILVAFLEFFKSG